MSKFVPLSPEQFKSKHWQAFRDYRHLRDQHWIAIAAPEVSQAAAHLPLGFIQLTDTSTYQLGALLGMKPGHNHCLTPENKWSIGYIPALFRAHPFRVLPTSAGGTKRTLCVDVESPWMNDMGEQGFFQNDNQLTPKVQDVLKYLTELEQHFFMTQKAVDLIIELDLLAPYHIKGIEGSRIGGVFQIDEDKLNQLSDQDWLKLRKSGGAAIAYAQLISTGQLPYLRHRAMTLGDEVAEEEIDLDLIFKNNDDILKFDF